MSGRAALKAAESGSLEGIEKVESAKEDFLRALQGLQRARRKVKLEGNDSGPSGAKGFSDANPMTSGVAPRIGVNVKKLFCRSLGRLRAVQRSWNRQIMLTV